MSAFGIGADSAVVKQGKRKSLADTNVPATLVKWIPGEAITFYAALIGFGSAQGALTGNETPGEILERIDAGSPSWFIAGAVIAAALVVIGAIASKNPQDTTRFKPAVALRVLLGVLGFTLWASALPGAWPYSWTFIRDLGPAYALLLVPVGAVAAGAAEWLTKRYSL